jgi:hypothetical protein
MIPRVKESELIIDEIGNIYHIKFDRSQSLEVKKRNVSVEETDENQLTYSKVVNHMSDEHKTIND